MLLFLICALLPTAIMAIAVSEGIRTRSPMILWALGLSAAVVTVTSLIPVLRGDELPSEFRFATARSGEGTETLDRPDFVHLKGPVSPQSRL